MRIDAHHHLWDLNAVRYPWLMETGVSRFFGDPAPIQRDYLLSEFRADAEAQGIGGSVHVQVGAADGWAEAQWVQKIADENPEWPMAQVVFCDLTSNDLKAQLNRYQTLSTVRGVRQIVGRAPGEDSATGTNALLDDPAFAEGLKRLGGRGLSFDLQLLPDLIEKAAGVLNQAPDTRVALCHCGSPHDRSEAGLSAWAASLRALSSLPQVTCKLSGLGMFEQNWTSQSVAPIVAACIGQFGPDRCMWGSNFPVDSLTSTYAELFGRITKLLTKEQSARVLGKTATSFYGFS